MRKFIKPVDLIIVFAVLVWSFLITYLFTADGAQYAVIYSDGKEYGRYSLENNQSQEIEVATKYGRNVVIIENKKVFVKESDCKDKVEIKAGSISKGGQSLVCLPNRLVVTIEGRTQTDATAF